LKRVFTLWDKKKWSTS